MSPSDPTLKAKEYALNKYVSIREDILKQSEEKIAQVRAHLTSRGLAISSVMARGIGEVYAERLTRLMEARVDALLDGFELYGVLITPGLEKFIIDEATKIRNENVEGITKAAASGLKGNASVRTLSVQFVERVNVPVPAIRCRVEERRMKARQAAQQTTVYHLYGDNSRVNVHSADQSVNVVEATSEDVFREIRNRITVNAAIEQQTAILDRLDALENAQHKPSFGERYTEFIAAAANHMNILAPFIPALTALLGKSFSG